MYVTISDGSEVYSVQCPRLELHHLIIRTNLTDWWTVSTTTTVLSLLVSCASGSVFRLVIVVHIRGSVKENKGNTYKLPKADHWEEGTWKHR